MMPTDTTKETTMDRWDEKAREIVDGWYDDHLDDLYTRTQTKTDLVSVVARALREAATVPEGYVREGVTDRKWCNRDEFVSGRVDYLITRPKADNLITSVSWTPDTGYVPHTAAEAAKRWGG